MQPDVEFSRQISWTNIQQQSFFKKLDEYISNGNVIKISVHDSKSFILYMLLKYL